MSGLQSWVLTTIVGWAVAMIVIFVGGRWVASLPPPPLPSPVTVEPRPAPQVVAALPPAGAAPAPSAPSAAPNAPPAVPFTAAPAGPTARLVVADPDGVNLRAEPSTASGVVASLPKGTVLEAQPPAEPDPAGWQRVTWNGRSGWVRANLVGRAEPAP